MLKSVGHTDNDTSVSSEEPPSQSAADPSTSPAATGVAAPVRPTEKTRENQWRDWRWHMRNRIRTVAQLKEWFPTVDVSAGLIEAAQKFPIALTPYYASLIRTPDPSDPIFQMAVPQGHELFDPTFLKEDPLEEDEDMPVPGLVHRYPDRALLIVTSTCSMYCRHCTRKRVSGAQESTITAPRLQQAVAYLRAHGEIHDVILSGGDPFTMSTDALERILSAVRSVPTVEIIRIGTRTPVVMPQRITDELVAMLRKYHPLWVNTHFNHPNELTPDAATACARLVDAGIPLGNQSVLLRGINDRPQVMEELCRNLVRMRVRPYYLFQCDLVRGVEHFRTPVARGIEIMEYLRGRVSGLAIPQFVVDTPHGGGKIPILPNYVVTMSPTHTVLRNFEGMLIAYPEPTTIRGDAVPPASSADPAPGVWDLASGKATVIRPAKMSRMKRREMKKDSGTQGHTSHEEP